MYDEWGDFSDVYGDVEDSLKPVMDGYNEGKQLITYLYDPTLYVFPQLENEIGYGVVCECPWEPEHQCSIMIRNDKVVYVGPAEGEDPWGMKTIIIVYGMKTMRTRCFMLNLRELFSELRKL